MNRLRVEVDGSIGSIILARPEKKNALDREAATDIVDAVRELEGMPAVRVIVLRAEGADFCAGADLAALKQMLDEPLPVHEADARALGDAFLSLHDSSRPTVAVVRGRALAGGAGLAASCDMIVAHESAVFGYPEVKIGFVPAMAMVVLLRWVSQSVAFDLVATGRLVRAEEALRLGLVSRVFAEADMDRGTGDLLQLLSSAPPAAFSATKSLLHELRGQSVEDGIAMGARTNAQARLTDEFRKGVLRFAVGAR